MVSDASDRHFLADRPDLCQPLPWGMRECARYGTASKGYQRLSATTSPHAEPRNDGDLLQNAVISVRALGRVQRLNKSTLHTPLRHPSAPSVMAASSSTAGAGEVQATYLTPTKKAAFANAEAGPSRARPAGASPAYVRWINKPSIPSSSRLIFLELPKTLTVRDRRSYSHRVSRYQLKSRPKLIPLGQGAGAGKSVSLAR